jgi:Bacterial EndoU nuclease
MAARDRPPPDGFRVSPERMTHILDGDPGDGGGGHRSGTGKPGKTEFPASWDDRKIINTALDVARDPDRSPVRQDWNDSWLCTGTRDGVDVSVVVLRSGEILTSWPEEGSPGVVRNPKKGHHD